MSTISDYSAAVDAKFTEIGADVDAIVASQVGVSDDVTSLKAIILKLETNPGPISAEDQALLTEGIAKVTALATKVAGVKDAMKALDDATAKTEVPVPTPPPTA